MDSNEKKPRRRSLNVATSKTLWLENFIAYCSGECHLAQNTVMAYHRDLERFFIWIDDRDFLALGIRDFASYVNIMTTCFIPMSITND